MERIRVAASTLNLRPLDWLGNRDRIVQVLLQAQEEKVDLLCLPELAISGYGCEDAFLGLEVSRRSEDLIAEILPETVGITVLIGLPHVLRGGVYNCAALVQNGKILGLNAKRLLPREGVHYEPRWFQPWPFAEVTSTTIAGETVPMGDLRYRLGPVGVAVEICEEAWQAMPASAIHAPSVDIVLNPSASHFGLGKFRKREQLVANASRALGVVYVYSNLVGNEAGRIIYDGGAMVAQDGAIIRQGRRFGFANGELTYVDVNVDLSRTAKLANRAAVDDSALARFVSETKAGHDCEINGDDPRKLRPASSQPTGSPFRPITNRYIAGKPPEEEFLQATTLGLWDYLVKSGARGFVVSLSGGCDSAATITLAAHAFAMALKELGPEEFCRKLGRAVPSADAENPRNYMPELLTCIYQGTENNSQATLDAARNLAQEIGASFAVANVQPLVDAYLKAGAEILDRDLNWQTDDLALQNIQSRSRAPLPWLIANVRGALLLTTCNRSESAVGYATMDGDTAGGLAPLAGIDKHFLRGWLRWAETQSEYGLGPLPSLGAVNSLAPTAELRPQSTGQTDEDDLMPYDVLEAVERHFVRDRMGRADILDCLQGEFSHYSRDELSQMVERFVGKWRASQWKRERMAPSFHLDDVSLDPKTWCRYPIFSGSSPR